MSDPREQVVRFLTSLAQASAALTLYERTHPAIERAIEVAFEQLVSLQESEPRPVLTFLGEEVVFGSLPLKSLSSWEWGRRLAELGVQRFECHGPVTRSDFDTFVTKLFDRITGTDTGPVVPDATSSIRFGLVGVGGTNGSLAQSGSAVQGYALAEEIAALKWVDDEVRSGGKLQMAEVHTVVRSLAVAMHADVEMMIPLVELKGFDQYTTTHSMNISVLSMALGEFIGLSSADVRRLGVAGLLHDIGKTKIPVDLLNKGGKLSTEERLEIERHPVEGAKILLQREANLDLAAMVAYEHHIRFDGGGYPSRKYRRPCHPASDLVHLCDVYDALRTHRPYRKAWGQDRVLDYMEESLGSEFDPELGQAFLEMMRRWGSRLHRITSKEDAVPIGQPDRPVDEEEPSNEAPAATADVKRTAPAKPKASRTAAKSPTRSKAPAPRAAAKGQVAAVPKATRAPKSSGGPTKATPSKATPTKAARTAAKPAASSATKPTPPSPKPTDTRAKEPPPKSARVRAGSQATQPSPSGKLTQSAPKSQAPVRKSSKPAAPEKPKASRPAPATAATARPVARPTTAPEPRIAPKPKGVGQAELAPKERAVAGPKAPSRPKPTAPAKPTAQPKPPSQPKPASPPEARRKADAASKPKATDQPKAPSQPRAPRQPKPMGVPESVERPKTQPKTQPSVASKPIAATKATPAAPPAGAQQAVQVDARGDAPTPSTSAVAVSRPGPGTDVPAPAKKKSKKLSRAERRRKARKQAKQAKKNSEAERSTPAARKKLRKSNKKNRRSKNATPTDATHTAPEAPIAEEKAAVEKVAADERAESPLAKFETPVDEARLDEAPADPTPKGAQTEVEPVDGPEETDEHEGLLDEIAAFAEEFAPSESSRPAKRRASLVVGDGD